MPSVQQCCRKIVLAAVKPSIQSLFGGVHDAGGVVSRMIGSRAARLPAVRVCGSVFISTARRNIVPGHAEEM